MPAPLARWTEIPIHVVDFEGSPRTGVVEYGVATLLGGDVINASTRLHAPRAAVPALDTQCHGLADKDLKGLTTFEAEWDHWVSLRRTGLLAAHNATVESGLLRGTWLRPPAVPAYVEAQAELAEWGPWIDTCRLARAWLPSLGDYRLASLVAVFRLNGRLDALAAKHCPPQRRRYHCALYDALASALVLRALCAVEGRSAATLAQLAKDSLSAPAADELSQGELEL
jgi:DNA polymerase-3 subunit epsilon